jgi:Nicotinamide mononucleotide transporter
VSEAVALLPWAGCVAGAAGSLLLALKMRHSGWGFAVYLVSNVAWIVVGLVTGLYALSVQGAIFNATAAVGVWQWLIRPRLRSRQAVPQACYVVTQQGAETEIRFVAPLDASEMELESAAFRALTRHVAFTRCPSAGRVPTTRSVHE